MKIKKFNESLGKESKQDLTNLRESLSELLPYDNLSISEAIGIITELIEMSWTDIEEWRESLATNYYKDDKDNFTLDIIDRHCSPFNEED